MAVEDFTTYTEVDPNSHITVTASRVAYAGLSTSEDAYVYKDKGVDHFAGDYEHLATVLIDAVTGDGLVFNWVLANLINDMKGIADAAGDYNGAATRYTNSDTSYKVSLYERVGASAYSDVYVGAVDTIYYLKIKRDEGVGTYGTLYCYIYSDAARTNLLDTLTLTLHEKEDFRYIYACNSYNNASGFTITGYTENLDLQEALTILPTGIASLETFGTSIITAGAVTLLPTAIASAEAIGAHTLQPGAVTLLPTAIASLEAFGTAIISGTGTILPTGIASLETFGTSIITAGALTISPSSIASAEAFGDLTIYIALAHRILEGSYREEIQSANRAQVFGDGVLTEDWDWDEIELVYDQLAQANDLNLDTTTKAHQRGEAILRNYQLSTLNGSILVPMNCGQDLYDVIAITSSQAGLDASKRRVLALTHTWTPSKGKYTLKLGLGAP